MVAKVTFLESWFSQLDNAGRVWTCFLSCGKIRRDREREREREMWLRPKGSLVLCMGFDVSF